MECGIAFGGQVPTTALEPGLFARFGNPVCPVMFSSALDLPETHDFSRIAEVVRYVSFGYGISLGDLAEFLSISRIVEARKLTHLACFLGFLKADDNTWKVTSTGLIFVAMDSDKQQTILKECLSRHSLYKYIFDRVDRESVHCPAYDSLPSVGDVQNIISRLAKQNGEVLSTAGGYLRNAGETVVELVQQITSKARWNTAGGLGWFNPYLGRGGIGVSDKIVESHRVVVAEMCSTLFQDTMGFGEDDVIAALMYSDTRCLYDEEELVSIIELCLSLKSRSYFCFIAWSMKYRNDVLLEGGEEPLCFATFIFRSLSQLSLLDRESVYAAFRPHAELGPTSTASTRMLVKKLLTHLDGARSFFDEQLNGILDDNYVEWEEISSGLDKNHLRQLEALSIVRIVRFVLSKEPLEDLDEKLAHLMEELLQEVVKSSQFRMELVDRQKLWGMAKDFSPLLVESYSKSDLFDNIRWRLREAGYLREREIAHGCFLPTAIAPGAIKERNPRVDSKPMRWLSWIESQRTTLGRDVRLRSACLIEMQQSYNEFVATHYPGGQHLGWNDAKDQILCQLQCSERGGRLWR